MVCSTLSIEKALTTFTLAAITMTCGCSTRSKDIGPDLAAYREALERTVEIPTIKAGSEAEREALERFNDFYAVYSADTIRKGIRDVYAEDAWFGDPYHAMKGIDNIEHYFILMAEPVEQCTFTIDAMRRAGNDYYAHWTMNLVSKAAGDQAIEAIGVSHVRFNADGKVVFQQDYWDTSVLLDRLPVVGFWTRLVKGRIMKGLEE